MSRHHRSPRPWRRWCSCCCRPPAGRRSALHPVPTDWTSCDVKKKKRKKKSVTFSVFEKLTTIKSSPTCCCWCLSVASSSCLVTGIQEVALAEAEESGRWSSEVTTAGWWGSCQEGTVGLAGLQLQQHETKPRPVHWSLLITRKLPWYYTHSFCRSLFVTKIVYEIWRSVETGCM